MDKKMLYDHLTNNIIPFWNKLKDLDFGGFFGFVSDKNIIDTKSDKGVILNNRILWFYSNAYLLLKDKSLLDNANHAYSFLANKLYDKTNGGVYWSVDYKGNPVDTDKHTYNLAFAVYSLSSYYDASGDINALNLALNLYNTIETKCKDSGGYRECFDINFKEASNEKLSENGVMAIRTMNTLLHVLESYTELYRVSKNDNVKASLYNALNLFSKYIYNKDLKRCEVFFDNDYNTLIDLESYGHEIEASWLITRAYSVLGDFKRFVENSDMIYNLAKSPYDLGMDDDKASMYYEAENGVKNEKRAWWVMAESVIGFYNAYTSFNDVDFLKASKKCYKFIMDNMVTEYGEWIEDYYSDKVVVNPLVHPWKCPYHNGRMLIEMIKRLNNQSPIDFNITEDALMLYNKLISVANNKKCMFGHQNDTWIHVSNDKSDVLEMVNDLPKILGIDTLALTGSEMNPNSQDDSLNKSIDECIKAYNEGCIITLSAHMPNFSSPMIIHDNDKILFNKTDFSDCKLFINDVCNNMLKGEKYNPEFNAYLDIIVKFLHELDKNNIPVIFRPWHECNGFWFFWGTDISDEKYIEIFRYTVDYLKKNDCHNVLYVYSPNGPFKSIDEYMTRYPGDDYIDILALDYYDDYLYNESYREDFFNKLDYSSMIVHQASILHSKIPAISEVGIRISKTPDNNDLNGLLKANNPTCGHDWFNRVKDIAIKYNMPYYLVWGDFCADNTYLPYYLDGKPHEMVKDFIDFYNTDNIIFAKKD